MTTVNKKLLIAAATAIALTGSLAACSADGGSGGGGEAASCTNTITKTDLPSVSVWGWYPNMDKVVDNFNAANDEVQACWTNVGQGNDEYDKFQTAISAGTGAPDVIMLEADRIPNYVVQNALVDISDFGYEDVKDNFSEGAWKDVSVGDAVYAAPVDGGPMGMIYRTDVFEQYGITPPTTWAEYEAAAQKVKDAGGPLFGDLGANVPAVFMALTIQNGAKPFTYDPTKPEEIGIKVNDAASKEVLDYWAGLVQKGLVGTQDQFTPEYISGVVGGDYATYVSAAWAPGYLSGAGVGEGDDAGKFATAPLPQWDSANPVSVNWGGSAFAVTSQSKQAELAAKVAFGIYADDDSLKDGWENQIIFPLNQSVLTSDEFLNADVAFFNGQQANKEVYIPAENAYKGFTYSPFGSFYYASFTEALAAINAGEKTGSEAADELQQKLVDYAKEQGFTVTD
jgi:multiple sugar transport system substrate-binding protein